MTEKTIAFDHISVLMAPGARVFGATIVQGSLPRSKSAQVLMNYYNNKGIFSNSNDTEEDLEAALRKRFRNVRIARKGTVVLFEATAHQAMQRPPP